MPEFEGSWWCRADADFTAAQRVFADQRKLLGDHDLSPALRRYFLEQELCQHAEASALKAPK